MGLDLRRTGDTYTKDGGIDILFWPRNSSAFPFLGAAQVKHRSNPQKAESSATVRDFAGVLAGNPFSVGLIVTNGHFSPDAAWFAKEKAQLLRLRDFQDVRRWITNNYSSDEEWREIPKSIEICLGITINLR